MAVKYLKDNLNKVKDKTVLLRLDLNEPISDSGKVLDDFRIVSAIPTIKLLLKEHSLVIICAHLGRPRGKKLRHLSMVPVAERLEELLGLKVAFYKGNIKTIKARDEIRTMPNHGIIFLENIRFYLEEEKNNPKFARKLASLADVYVNDAFGSIHRKEASITGVPKYIPGFVGPLVQKEMTGLEFILQRARKPFVTMIAGLKMTDKARALDILAKRSDYILLGGGIANLIYKSKGFEIGVSSFEKSAMPIAKLLYRTHTSKIILPADLVVTNKRMDKSSIKVVEPQQVGPRDRIVDIGPKTILAFAKILKGAQTIVWNGPLGNFEVKPFDTGTMALAKVVGGVSKGRAFGLVGGGETVDSIRLAGQEKYIDHLSTGGGAMLAYLSGQKLAGIEALK